MIRRRRRAKTLLITVVLLVLVGTGAFLGMQYYTKTGIFKIPGVVYYDESLDDDELAQLEMIFSDEIELDEDVAISAYYALERPDEVVGEFIDRIYVPVTDFYSTETNVTAESPEELMTNLAQNDNSMGGTKDAEGGVSDDMSGAGGVAAEYDFAMIDVDELDATKKLLSINDSYHLDDFKSGAVYRVIKFTSENYDAEIAPLIGETFARQYPEKDTVLTFAQTGVTAMSRGMNKRLNAVGGDATYFSEQIADFLAGFDITHTSNESSFTKYATSENICSDKRFINTLLDIGLDIVELTGNHNQDCGDEAALETIDMYDEHNIQIVGGGKTAEEAAKPLEIVKKGTDITFLAYNLSTGGVTLDATPGANQYYEDSASSEIAAAKEKGNFVVVDIQYYECSAYASEYEDPTCDYADSAAGDQVGFFRHLIDLGADVVVGTSAHQPQTYELYGNGVIYYGLGNLFFDQVWWPGTTRSLVLAHYLYNGKLLQTKIIPTVYGDDMQTKLLDKETAKWFLERLIKVRP